MSESEELKLLINIAKKAEKVKGNKVPDSCWDKEAEILRQRSEERERTERILAGNSENMNRFFDI